MGNSQQSLKSDQSHQQPPEGGADPKVPLRFDVNPSIQVFESKATKVYDVSSIIKEAPAVNNVGLLTVAADEIFTPGTIFMGMGIPNVYLAHVIGPKSVKVVAAKSLYREETKVVESGGRVQSGIFF